jgi:glycosyltransferase involved in cell wall biosynthesis
MDDLTLLIPAKFEKESLHQVIDELEKYNLNILVVLEKDDLETINSIKNKNCKILYQIDKGYGDALIYGIENVKTQYFCIFNADGSFDPSELSTMYKKIKEDNFDFVFGSRYLKSASSEDDTIITFVGNKIFSFIGKVFFSLPISDILYTFVMGNSKIAKSLNLKEKSFSFCIELPIIAKRSGYNLISIPSNERSRIAGQKKVNAFRDGLKILISMIKIYFKS